MSPPLGLLQGNPLRTRWLMTKQTSHLAVLEVGRLTRSPWAHGEVLAGLSLSGGSRLEAISASGGGLHSWLPAHPFVLKATWAAKYFSGQSPLTLPLLSLSWPHEGPAVALGTWITPRIHVDPGAPSSSALHPR